MTDIRTMTDQQLEQHVERLYGQWMFHEAAERGYDHVAASQAGRLYDGARAELELRRSGYREKAKPLTDLIGALIG